MPHVQICAHPAKPVVISSTDAGDLTTGLDEPSAYSITVDGVDMSFAILREGFSVSFDADGPPRLTMTIAADVLDIDLPEVAIEALREAEAVA